MMSGVACVLFVQFKKLFEPQYSKQKLPQTHWPHPLGDGTRLNLPFYLCNAVPAIVRQSTLQSLTPDLKL